MTALVFKVALFLRCGMVLVFDVFCFLVRLLAISAPFGCVKLLDSVRSQSRSVEYRRARRRRVWRLEGVDVHPTTQSPSLDHPPR